MPTTCKVCGAVLKRYLRIGTETVKSVELVSENGKVEEVMMSETEKEESFYCPECLSKIGGDGDEPGADEKVSREED